MEDIYIVCVLYNKEITDISSYEIFLNTVQRHQNVHCIIVDNSNEEYVIRNQKYAENQDDISYICCNGNAGLSGAYNQGLRMIKTETDDAFMMIADDDTIFSDAYMECLVHACEQGKNDVYSGIIHDKNGKCLSPNSAFDWLGRDKYAIQQPGVYDNIYCFNSGICINIALLDLIGGFEERLFVDMIDYWLMDTLKANGKNRVCIVSGEILQDFSATTFNDLEAVLRRYHIFKKDFEMYCNICNKGNVFKWYYGNRRKINVLFHILIKGRFDLVKEL